MLPKLYHFLIVLSIIVLILTTQTGSNLSYAFAQTESEGLPQTMDEAIAVGQKFITELRIKLPAIMDKILREEAFAIWKKMWVWAKGLLNNIWENYIASQINALQGRLRSIILEKIKERLPIVKEEFGKEKSEVSQELPSITKVLWDKITGIMK